MKINDEQIEAALRGAPRPKAPSNLKSRLISGIQVSKGDTENSPGSAPRNWFSRWWPVLGPGAVSLACAAVITLQQMEIREVKNTIASLPATSESGAAVPATASPAATDGKSRAGDATDNGELDRLRAEAEALKADVAQLEQLQIENAQLRVRLQAASSPFSSDETAFLQAARDRAQSIACVNNLKQIGLACRIWALDNNDKFAPSLVCMSNELSTPKILVCPADTNRVVAPNFFNFASANCSYEYFGADGNETNPTQLLSRCPLHGHIGLVDGSVQSRIAKEHPEKLIQREGKLYFVP